MSLRERKDCTDEALVPRASAIQSSVLPASTHSRICSMWGFIAMRFLESAILPPAPSCLSTRSLLMLCVKLLIDGLLMMPGAFYHLPWLPRPHPRLRPHPQMARSIPRALPHHPRHLPHHAAVRESLRSPRGRSPR